MLQSSPNITSPTMVTLSAKKQFLPNWGCLLFTGFIIIIYVKKQKYTNSMNVKKKAFVTWRQRLFLFDIYILNTINVFT
jgi:hypothetical protein